MGCAVFLGFFFFLLVIFMFAMADHDSGRGSGGSSSSPSSMSPGGTQAARIKLLLSFPNGQDCLKQARRQAPSDHDEDAIIGLALACASITQGR
jgi:hypothetical protein